MTSIQTDHGISTPRKAHDTDAAFDIFSNEQVELGVGDIHAVHCGFRIDIPEGMAGLVCPRSGLAVNHGITVLNAPGIIDPGYLGEVKVVLANFGRFGFEIFPGDRIAQLLIVRTVEMRWLEPVGADQFDVKYANGGRGVGGFGSTGI